MMDALGEGPTDSRILSPIAGQAHQHALWEAKQQCKNQLNQSADDFKLLARTSSVWQSEMARGPLRRSRPLLHCSAKRLQARKVSWSHLQHFAAGLKVAAEFYTKRVTHKSVAGRFGTVSQAQISPRASCKFQRQGLLAMTL